MQEFEAACAHLQRTWRERVGATRRNSARDRILFALPGAPVLTVAAAVHLTGRSHQAVTLAMAQLLRAGIVRQTTAGRRNRAFEAPEVIAAFTDLERRLARPRGDTRAARPIGPVPARLKGRGRHR